MARCSESSRATNFPAPKKEEITMICVAFLWQVPGFRLPIKQFFTIPTTPPLCADILSLRLKRTEAWVCMSTQTHNLTGRALTLHSRRPRSFPLSHRHASTRRPAACGQVWREQSHNKTSAHNKALCLALPFLLAGSRRYILDQT